MIVLVTHFLDRIHTSPLRSLWHRLHNSCEQFFYYYFQCGQEAFSEFCSLDIFTCLLQKMMFHRCLFLCIDTVHFNFLRILIRAVPATFVPEQSLCACSFSTGALGLKFVAPILWAVFSEGYDWWACLKKAMRDEEFPAVRIQVQWFAAQHWNTNQAQKWFTLKCCTVNCSGSGAD